MLDAQGKNTAQRSPMKNTDPILEIMQSRIDLQTAGCQDAFLHYEPRFPKDHYYMIGYQYEKDLQLQDYFDTHGEKNYKEWRD